MGWEMEMREGARARRSPCAFISPNGGKGGEEGSGGVGRGKEN